MRCFGNTADTPPGADPAFEARRAPAAARVDHFPHLRGLRGRSKAARLALQHRRCETIGTLDRADRQVSGLRRDPPRLVPPRQELRGAGQDRPGRRATTSIWSPTFPELEETSPAYLSLAEFAINANNHPLAITYLKELEKRPEDPHYPFALYKLAWSYYNIKDTAHAMSYAERQIAVL